MNHQPTIYELTTFLLQFGVKMVSCGSHTARVVKCVRRMGHSFGYEVEVMLLQKNVSITLISQANASVSNTAIMRIPPAHPNFYVVSELSSLSWNAFDEGLEFEVIVDQFKKITERKPFSRWFVLLAVACANGAFAALFEADNAGIIVVFVATLLGFFTRQQLTRWKMNPYITVALSSFVASFTAGNAMMQNIGTTPDVALAVSVLYLIPGVPMINSFIDFLEGHVLSGLSRLISAFLLIGALVFGFFITLTILGIDRL